MITMNLLPEQYIKNNVPVIPLLPSSDKLIAVKKKIHALDFSLFTRQCLKDKGDGEEVRDEI